MTKQQKLLTVSCVIISSISFIYPNTQEAYAGKSHSKTSLLEEQPLGRTSLKASATPSENLQTVLQDLRASSAITFQKGAFPVKKKNGCYLTPYCEGSFTSLSTAFSPEIVLKKVIPGKDGRAPVVDTEDPEYRVHGKIKMTFVNKKGEEYSGGGSGTLISPHHVLTAGHCLFSRKYGWAKRVEFFPGRNKEKNPYGGAVGSMLLSVKGWVENLNEEYDMGVLVLDRPIGYKTGWLGLCSAIEENAMKDIGRRKVHVTGYPGDKGGNEMWTMGHTLKNSTSKKLFYEIDTYGGQSGSGVWTKLSEEIGHHVIGIHTYGDRSTRENSATRITFGKFMKVLGWLKEYQLKELLHPSMFPKEENYGEEAEPSDLESTNEDLYHSDSLEVLKEEVHKFPSDETFRAESPTPEKSQEDLLKIHQGLGQQFRILKSKLYDLVTCCFNKK